MPSPPRAHGSTYSGIGHADAHPMPTADELESAAEVLNAGRRVAVLAGAGALGATNELIEVCEILGAGAAKALHGKAALPDDLPFVTGGIGVLGTRPSWFMMQNCDTLLLVGTTFPDAEFLPPDGQARAVQIDVNPRNVGIHQLVRLRPQDATRHEGLPLRQACEHWEAPCPTPSPRKWPTRSDR